MVIPASNLTSTPGVILTAIPPNVFFPITHADPPEDQFDAIAIAAQVASEVAAEHSVEPTTSPSTDREEFAAALEKMVNSASFSMMKEGPFSLVPTSGGDTDMMKFCGLTIMGLSKKFEQFETELAKAKEECDNANAKRLAAEVAAAKALKELEVLAIQSKKDQALISDTDSKAKELQAEIEKAVLGVMTLSSESKRLKEEKDVISAKYAESENHRTEIQASIEQKSEVFYFLYF